MEINHGFDERVKVLAYKRLKNGCIAYFIDVTAMHFNPKHFYKIYLSNDDDNTEIVDVTGECKADIRAVFENME